MGPYTGHTPDVNPGETLADPPFGIRGSVAVSFASAPPSVGTATATPLETSFSESTFMFLAVSVR